MHSDAGLEQNVPNSFNKTTTIGYILPQQFSKAQIVVTDDSGKIVKQINVSGSRKGNLNIDTAKLPTGVYNYSLIIDKRVISTKQMIMGK